MKKVIRLTEGDLHRIIKESVKRVLREQDYTTPAGGFDSRAYEYDEALKNANSLEDWDRMMADRDKYVNMRRDSAVGCHPANKQYGNGSLGAYKYTHSSPEKSDDEVLKDLENDANTERKLYGYPL
jgi:hypothetical protein